MNAEFAECLKREKIKPFSAGPRLVAKELRTARADLNAAQETLRLGNAKWATIQASDAMFHAGRALLYAKGYRERSHYCLVIALRAFYQGAGGLAPQLLYSRRFSGAGRFASTPIITASSRQTRHDSSSAMLPNFFR